jgi:chemotaxis protein histidine kinase CheA
MADDVFAERLAKIRARFAANLTGKLDLLDQALPELSGESDHIPAALVTAHRSVHELCGMAPTIGFVATGRAARAVERVLIQSLRARRGLTESEVASVRQDLTALRAAARSELQLANGHAG